MKKFFFIFFLVLLTFSCSKGDLDNFQKSSPEPEYRLFSLLDDFPALKNAFTKLDQTEFNRKLADPLNQNLDASEDVIALLPQFLDPASKDLSFDSLLTAIIKNIRNVFYRVIYQDDLDNLEAEEYADNFFSLYERLLESDLGLADDLVKVVGKLVAYIYVKYGGEELEECLVDLKEFLADRQDPQNFYSVLEKFTEGFGKLLLKADTNMFLEGDQLLTAPEQIDLDLHFDTELGNSVLGIDLFLSGLNVLLKDEEIQTCFFDILRELGNLTSKREFGSSLKYFLKNLEYFFIEGGEGFKGDYSRNDEEEYVNASVTNSFKELWPALQQLFIGAGKKNSIFKEDLSGDSPVEALARVLFKSDFDLDGLNIEESLERVIKLDDRGRDRTDSDSGASNTSFLDALIFTFMTANVFGYKTSSDFGLVTLSELEPNFGYGHGEATGGIISLGDTLYSLGTAGLGAIDIDLSKLNLNVQTFEEIDTEINVYSLCLQNPRGDKIFRSKNKFTREEANLHSYYLYADSPVLTALSSHLAGDLGLPNGGEGIGSEGGLDEHTTFFPYCPNGVGDLNTARWAMGLIARICWEGEGPYYYADSEAPTVTFQLNDNEEEKSWYVYYRPNGKVYALVAKDPNNLKKASEWEYLYPADINDPVDVLENYDLENEQDVPPKEIPASSGFTKFSSLERANRYKATWHTDYYLIENHSPDDLEEKYWAPDKADSQTEANCYWINEIISENEVGRACASQEEAIYKNFQWLMYEKKIFFMLPLRINLEKELIKSMNLSVDLVASAFVKLEANGVMGLANLHKKDLDTESLSRILNSIQDGSNFWMIEGGADNSSQPGDSRMGVEIKDPSLELIHDIILYNFVLNPTSFIGLKGYVMPDVFGANISSIGGLGILKNNKVYEDKGYFEGIPSAEVKAEDGDDYWEERNRLLPILVSFLGTLHEKNYYEPAAQGHDYNVNGNHVYPFKILTDSLLPPLAKPMFYYQKNKEGLEPVDCWKPRIKGGNDFLARHKNRIDKKYKPNYFAPRENRTLLSILSESEYKRCDGLLYLISQTKLVTNLLKFFQRLGSDSFDSVNYDQNDFSTWGARRKIFYGLEQILTTVKTSKGEEIYNNSTPVNYARVLPRYEEWMYKDNFLREEDISLDSILEELIGSRNTGKGLATFVYNRSEEKKDNCYQNKLTCLENCDPADEICSNECLNAYQTCEATCYDWDNFDRFTESLGPLLSDNSFFEEQYNLLENVINIIDKLLNKVEVSDQELEALRHTLGIIFTAYDQDLGWVTQEELKKLLTENLPQALEIFDQHNTNFFLVMKNFLEDDSFVEYFLVNLHSDYSADITFEQWYQFLGIELVDNPNSTLWLDLIEILEGAIGIMERDDIEWIDKEFQDNGVW